MLRLNSRKGAEVNNRSKKEQLSKEQLAERAVEAEVAQRKELAKKFAGAVSRLQDDEAGVALAQIINSLRKAYKERCVTCPKEDIDIWRGAAYSMESLRAALSEAVEYLQAETDEEPGLPDDESDPFTIIPGVS
jgi:urease accessory protein UreH